MDLEWVLMRFLSSSVDGVGYPVSIVDEAFVTPYKLNHVVHFCAPLKLNRTSSRAKYRISAVGQGRDSFPTASSFLGRRIIQPSLPLLLKAAHRAAY